MTTWRIVDLKKLFAEYMVPIGFPTCVNAFVTIWKIVSLAYLQTHRQIDSKDNRNQKVLPHFRSS